MKPRTCLYLNDCAVSPEACFPMTLNGLFRQKILMRLFSLMQMMRFSDRLISRANQKMPAQVKITGEIREMIMADRMSLIQTAGAQTESPEQLTMRPLTI